MSGSTLSAKVFRRLIRSMAPKCTMVRKCMASPQTNDRCSTLVVIDAEFRKLPDYNSREQEGSCAVRTDCLRSGFLCSRLNPSQTPIGIFQRNVSEQPQQESIKHGVPEIEWPIGAGYAKIRRSSRFDAADHDSRT